MRGRCAELDRLVSGCAESRYFRCVLFAALVSFYLYPVLIEYQVLRWEEIGEEVIRSLSSPWALRSYF